MSGEQVKRIITILAIVSTITVNALANILPFNNKTTGEIANQYPVYFSPAAYVFFIWTLIYLAIIVWTIYQSIYDKQLTIINHIRPWFWLSCLANSAWMILWHYQYVYSTVIVMGVLLLSLVMIYRQITRKVQTLSLVERLYIQFPFSIYLAWICIATIANVSVALYVAQWNGLGISGPVWSVMMMVVASIVAALIIMRYQDIAFGLVIMWSLIGIAVKFTDNPLIFNSAIILSGIHAIIIVRVLLNNVIKTHFKVQTFRQS
jgi:hypothetical protein